MQRISVVTVCAVWVWVSALVGCSKEELSELVNQAKETASEGTAKVKQVVSEKLETQTERVQQQLHLAGRIELEVGAPLQTDACYAALITPGSNRPNVLQLQSYREAERESFPAVFLQAQVSAKTPAELVGQVLRARLFVQPAAPGTVLFSPPETPVDLKVVSVEGKMLSAELVNATLHDAASGASVTGTGRFTAVLP